MVEAMGEAVGKLYVARHFPPENKARVLAMVNNFLATFRGRVGYAGFGPVLPYLTGGLAVGDIEARSSLGSSTTTRAGWTVGTSVEWAVVGPWTAKVEYLYADLGKASCPTGICSTTAPTDVKLTENVVRAGLNYRFGGAYR